MKKVISFFALLLVFSLYQCSDDTSNTDTSGGSAATATHVRITYISNDGVYISDGKRAVVIDALGTFTGWRNSTSTVQTQLQNGTGNFKNIKAAMITHQHTDHYNTSSVTNFLSAHPGAILFAPPQIRGNWAGLEVNTESPAFGTSVEVMVDSIKITILHMRHFDLFGNDFSNVQNYSYLVEFPSGEKILHVGDVDYSTDNFLPFNLASQNIDAILMPTFNELVSSSNNTLINTQVNPGLIIGLHLQTSTSVSSVLNVFPGAKVFASSLEFHQFQ